MAATTTMTATIAATQRFWQGFNTHNLELWDEVCAPDFVHHHPGLTTADADLVTTKRTVKQLILKVFPDLQSFEQDLLVDGDKVLTRRLLRGTHRGEFMGIAPTGKEVTAGGLWLAHFRNGKIKEQWVYFDVLGLLLQIGAFSMPGHAGS
jgi:predicted ester cyclase